ncbi:MAG: flavin reductase family protein [Lachnospiraceae bacterium]|nr:flavin reductase family protein [Lachnospiraceae bacterium]
MKQNWKPGNLLNPVPVVMLSCAEEGGKPNIITLAWVGTVCSEPPMLSVSIRKNRFSHGIVSRSGEFAVNLVPAKLAKACDLCGVKSGRDTDKFAAAHLTAAPAPNLKYAPLIAECPVNLECRVEKVLELGSHDMFVARIVGVQVEDSLLDPKGRLDLTKADLIVYSHGEYAPLKESIGKFGFSVKKK